jgi:hypothetical protein
LSLTTSLVEKDSGWYVLIMNGRAVIDEAGPFDTEDEAVDAEERVYS